MVKERVDYHQYLASREWALKKEAVRERPGGICERCHSAPIQSTHHLTYERLGNELLEDLQGLCRPCHEFLSAKRDDDPLQTPPATQPQLIIQVGPDEEQHILCPVCSSGYGSICSINADMYVREVEIEFLCYGRSSDLPPHNYTVIFESDFGEDASSLLEMTKVSWQVRYAEKSGSEPV
jgi:hypothetical protein